MTAAPLRIAIAGGGIGGLAAAIALHRTGHDVRVYERRADPLKGGGAMLMWPNGFAALDTFGLGAKVRAGATEIGRVDFRTSAGRPVAQWVVDAKQGTPQVRLVYRVDLLRALWAAAPREATGFGQTVSGFCDRADGVDVAFDGGVADERADVLVGCDGVGSRIRAQLFGGPTAPTVRQLAWFGTVEHDDVQAAPHGVAVATMGDGRRFCSARVDARRVFWYATANLARRPKAAGAAALAGLFEGWHAPIQALIRAASDDEIGPVALTDLAPPRRLGRGRVTLLGDAAHACLPDLGQGAGQALESAVTLGACFAMGGPFEDALRDYEDRRRTAVGTAMRMSRFVATWSMSEALHVTGLRDSVARHLLPAVGFPMISRLARLGF